MEPLWSYVPANVAVHFAFRVLPDVARLHQQEGYAEGVVDRRVETFQSSKVCR